ncbi:uncharacterized protein LOC123546002 [Mercenaria mercenaria]|uniref:uncharacterized protein LOC123546002 n=1 Tax=Mercenaria mercenaria TaxID=6596 RepID=UPI00234F0DB8|nr:uncharacterized protein LOC123546002 [Mercenaria mercenaria]
MVYITDNCCKPCNCDRETCLKTRSCCPDVLPNNYLEYTGIVADIYEESESPMRVENTVEEIPMCEPTRLIPKGAVDETNYYMISTCPRVTVAGLRMNCTRTYTKELQEFTDFLPVYSHSTLSVYRNKYCALCNGVQQKDIKFWKLMLKCGKDMYKDINSQSEVISLVFADTVCDLHYQKPYLNGLNTVQCESSISRCNVTGNWNQYDPDIEAGCLIYRSEFFYMDKKYQNIFCVLCNAEIPGTNKCFYGEEGPPWSQDKLSFSGLLKLELTPASRHEDRDLASTHSKCSVDQIFNPVTKNCAELHCHELSALQNGQCLNKFEYIIDDVMYIISLQLESVENITIGEVFDTTLQLLKNVRRILKNSVNFIERQDQICDILLILKSDARFGTESNDVYMSTFVHGEVVIQMARSGGQIVQDLADAVQNVYKTSFYTYFQNRSLKFMLSAKDTRQYPRDKINTLIGTNFDSLLNPIDEPESMFSLFSIFFFPDKDNSTLIPVYKKHVARCYFTLEPRKVINVLRFTSCPKVNVSRPESPWQLTDSGVNISGLLINSNQYYHDGTESVIVCSDSFKKSHLDRVISGSLKTEVIVSIVCTALSLVSLTIAFCTFCYFSELRKTLPGKNNVALITTLLIAQVMFLIGSLSPFPKYSVPCTLAGMFLHFSWLAALFWMNVCTYHMFKTLSNMRLISGDSGWKKMLFYLLYVLSMSILFVAINVIIATSTSAGIGYGGTNCYITSQDRIMITLGVPVAFVILSNVCMFLSVIFKIKRSPTVNRNIKHERNDLLIFSKLSTITGATWVFGLLYAWTDMLVFSYLFIVLNAGQGVFIMFAFIINRRVYAMCKQAFCKDSDTIMFTTKRKTTSSNGHLTKTTEL